MLRTQAFGEVQEIVVAGLCAKFGIAYIQPGVDLRERTP